MRPRALMSSFAVLVLLASAGVARADDIHGASELIENRYVIHWTNSAAVDASVTFWVKFDYKCDQPNMQWSHFEQHDMNVRIGAHGTSNTIVTLPSSTCPKNLFRADGPDKGVTAARAAD